MRPLILDDFDSASVIGSEASDFSSGTRNNGGGTIKCYNSGNGDEDLCDSKFRIQSADKEFLKMVYELYLVFDNRAGRG